MTTADLTRFDRLLLRLGFVDTVHKRASARINFRRYLDSAVDNRLTGGWGKIATASNHDIFESDGRKSAQRARWLVANDAYARAAANALVDATVGTGITVAPKIAYRSGTDPTSTTANQSQNAAVADLRDRWNDEADATGAVGWDEMSSLWFSEVVVEGEAFLHRRQLVDDFRAGRRVLPLAYEFIQPAQLAEYRSTPKSGNDVISGIEFDKTGRRVAYHIETGLARTKIQRIPAEDMIHSFRMDMPGMLRGITWFAPIIPDLSYLREVKEYALVSRKVQQAIALVISRKPGARTPSLIGNAVASGADSTNAAGDVLGFLEPGAIHNAGEGEVHSHNPSQSNDLDALTRLVLRSIAIGIGISYERLSGDYERTNFAGGRLSDQNTRRRLDWTHAFAVNRLSRPVHREFIDNALATGAIAQPPATAYPYAATYSRPRAIGGVNPLQDTRAAIMAIDSGISTIKEQVENKGGNWREYLEQVRDEIDFAAALDLSVHPKLQGIDPDAPTTIADDTAEEQRADAEALRLIS
tara:strand:- start:18411 stop:19991 length:1581 start_codon:yes stop_codon:yes gene_type:complete